MKIICTSKDWKLGYTGFVGILIALSGMLFFSGGFKDWRWWVFVVLVAFLNAFLMDKMRQPNDKK
ncbi:hypothetical protein LCGC14_0417020 [marine sediment metagenome]|uniref:Uncharacterized protein n=1 Tax=marine sediment metagenome TaxID=412755 RepID=A0A0F9W1C9_9ZZZZ